MPSLTSPFFAVRPINFKIMGFWLLKTCTWIVFVSYQVPKVFLAMKKDVSSRSFKCSSVLLDQMKDRIASRRKEGKLCILNLYTCLFSRFPDVEWLTPELGQVPRENQVPKWNSKKRALNLAEQSSKNRPVVILHGNIDIFTPSTSKESY